MNPSFDFLFGQTTKPLKETPALRRLREAAKAKTGEKGLKTGLGNNAALGLSLADLKL